MQGLILNSDFIAFVMFFRRIVDKAFKNTFERREASHTGGVWGGGGVRKVTKNVSPII